MTVPPKRRTRRSIPAVLMRAGTSKGLFLHRAHLPPSESDWAAPLLAIMGSRYQDVRQIDGVGGASSVTSKVAVVSPSDRAGVDVDYTFVQVAVGDETIDLTGNCGNMCAGVGPFAIQEGLVPVPISPVPRVDRRSVDVRIFNTNTERLIVESVEVDEDGHVVEDGPYRIPGVKGPGSEIKVAFVDPAGSMTSALFPTGRRSERIHVEHGDGLIPPFSVEVTLIDAANPFVIVDADTLPALIRSQPRDSPLSLEVAESIRRIGAVHMGLAATVEAAALVRGTPKLVYVSRPPAATPLSAVLRGKEDETADQPDVQVLAYSMGRPHPSLQLTGGVGLASAVAVEGTVANRLSKKGKMMGLPLVDGLPPSPERTPSPSSLHDGQGSSLWGARVPEEAIPDTQVLAKRNIRLAHSSGVMEVENWMRPDGERGLEIDRCIVSRTARRLFEGNVFYYA
ncbi:methylitaconate delta2-delta3-isomerase [Apiospora aurea]|uniref:Methylitaconate delta2-delta3-isomerase n=1 Tax=Apiospora aurea TaxID=335848 RepID=A0ABR1Q5M7_9PEZI